MMTPSPLRRFLALFVGVLLLLSGAGEAAGVRPCPNHSGMVAAAEAGGHGHHGMQHGDSAPAEHAPCNCGDHCTTPAGLALPPDDIAYVEAVTAATPLVLRTEAQARPARQVAHLLPYAQAPPRAG